MKSLLSIFCSVLFFSFSGGAAEPAAVKIEPGANPEKYTNEELRRRVFQLEQAVLQLQTQAATAPAVVAPPPDPKAKTWTCVLKVADQTLEGAGPSRYESVKAVLKKCREVTSPIRCHDTAAKCKDE